MRLKPRFNAEVNHWWICDEGRYGYKFIDDPSRISLARVKEKGEFLVLTLDQVIGRAGEKLREALEKVGRDSVVVVASPRLTNEDLFVIRKFFGEDLGLSQIDFRVPDQNLASGDDFLLRADRNPNSRGAEAVLLDENGFDLTQLLRMENSRKLQLLCLFEQDLTKTLGEAWTKKFLPQFEYVIYVASNENETSVLSHLTLPSATYAETEGTFTNFEGRVQKINQAVEPLGDSLPTWQIVSKLACALGYRYNYENAEEVFGELAERVVEFEDLAYEKIGDSGVEIPDISNVQV